MATVCTHPLRAAAAAAATVVLLSRGSESRLGDRQLTGSHGQSQSLNGFEYYASSTIYGDTPMTSCGSLDTRELVQGTEYFAVASAQAMQADFDTEAHGGGCSWECQTASGTKIDRCTYEHPPGTLSNSAPLDGCSCKQVGACMCGKAGVGAGPASGTAPMGCFTCGRGHFLQRNPYQLDSADGHKLKGTEIKVVVADVCPYGPNYKWCPAVPGEQNAAGARNHFDFATKPDVKYDNNFFVFTPEACSDELLHRMRNATSCPASTWPGAAGEL
eukprot:CAMPEP_0177342054 /NCGR_PEP_ID=MMETSP0368-20130122/26838_1 /TAXON_ID=447022 ORGANISM="Scrippsiella hangoei-like, Strain SHHI-4" /NCGR_SAMPLE_ID=MMETSP0368 /ASSEMBLY_ACC=CAM_ASM_000363 /LENGTH=272 /DNA_ID=CAMNT_0018803395 /DNA_START=55 /DNA_END=873 /DNA_ORIENTATION=+